MKKQKPGYHLMAKPVGPVCNMNCTYCFYLEKENLFSGQPIRLMSDQVLEQYIRKYITTQDSPVISFVWQGGEPMLAGMDFYRKALALQRKYARGKTIQNSIQTNGTLIDETWCRFFQENSISIGLSLDGPEDIHNRYRVFRGGKPTHSRVMESLRLLQQYGIACNVLVCIAKDTCADPVRTYRFLKDAGVRFIQYTPVVERIPDDAGSRMGLHNASPDQDGGAVADFSVPPEAFGDYMIQVFDEWVKDDVGKIFVMNFEWALTNWMGLESTICIYGQTCGGCAIIEHNGDIYSCDHYMYPRYRLGNILRDMPDHLLQSEKQQQFALKKAELPDRCKICGFLFACRGECPRHRFVEDSMGQGGRISYLCPGYRKYFRHIAPYMKAMVQLIQNGLPASDVMKLKDGPIIVMPDSRK